MSFRSSKSQADLGTVAPPIPMCTGLRGRTTSLLINKPGGYTRNNRWTNLRTLNSTSDTTGTLWTTAYGVGGQFNREQWPTQCNSSGMTTSFSVQTYSPYHDELVGITTQ